MLSLFECFPAEVQQEFIQKQQAEAVAQEQLRLQVREGHVRSFNSAVANLGKPNLTPKAVAHLNATVVQAVASVPTLRPRLQKVIEKRRYQAMLTREVTRHAR
jgi:hypothetical protein